MTLDPVHSGIDLWPLLFIPHMSAALVPPMPALSVCTISAEELSDRTGHGEDHFDVIEEHTSWFWFRNREGYEIARRTARNILRGNLVTGNVPAGVGLFCPNVDGVMTAPIVTRFSAHHLRTESSSRPDASVVPVGIENIVSTPDGCNHDAAASPVGLVERAAANPAGKRVAFRRLEHGLYLLLEAACAQIMGRLAPRMLRAQGVDRRAKLGPGHFVSLRLRLKALRLLLFVLKIEERIIQRHIRLLGDDNLLVEIGDLLLHCADVRIRLCDECLRILKDLARGLQCGDAGLGQTDEARNVL